MRKRQAQVSDLEEILKEFEEDIKLSPAYEMPMPISSRDYPGQEHPNRNMNRTNPFIDNGGTVKQTGDDQEQTTNESFNDMGGYLPVMASRKRKLRLALWDAQQMPAGMDFAQLATTPERPEDALNDNEEMISQRGIKRRNWPEDQFSKDVDLKLYHRPNGVEEQINPGIRDPTIDDSSGTGGWRGTDQSE